MEQEFDSDKKQDELTWLENLQRNSWEPEVIISGITLAFLFIFPAKIYEFCAYINQELGVGYLFSLLLVFYLTAIISVFKIFFVLHLCLRFFWTGLLGLSYAFPHGAINEKLFKAAQNYNYQKPEQMVLRMEKICSMTFAFPLSLVITILVITLYLGLLVAVYVWFDLTYLTVYLIFMTSLLILSLGQLSKKKSKFKTWYSQTIISSIGAIYQSNLGKWFAVFYSLFIFVLATPIITSDVKDFSLFSNETNLNEFEQEWPAKNQTFQDLHDPNKRFPRVFIPSEEINEDFLKLGIARFEGDRKILEDLNNQFQTTIDTLNWHQLDETADLHRIYIDDSLVKIDHWEKFRLPETGQRIYQGVLDIKELSQGVHHVRVEKLLLIYGFTDNVPDVKFRQNWSKFSFIKK
ncbi:hypothetical protein [Algoriphagus pacificus]|uniref:Uncharacterized protein n=1 Tax=Algoriphagus pacificus TaxID=2811234 RepID=A0ABS3CFV5_9BACT|nr:hypothetical protein [Algoriphagus pacificus]MBN7814524.1 hypothetical protein [Algoriphagus pacificus]